MWYGGLGLYLGSPCSAARWLGASPRFPLQVRLSRLRGVGEIIVVDGMEPDESAATTERADSRHRTIVIVTRLGLVSAFVLCLLPIRL